MKCLRFILPAAVLAISRGAGAEFPAPNRTAPSFDKPALVAGFSANPTTEEIGRVRVLDELLVPMGSSTPSVEENRLLAAALLNAQKTRTATGTADIAQLEQFLLRFPDSAWAPSLRTNLGIEYYRRGSFSKALDAWQRAWDLGKSESAPQAVAVINRAVAELARMHARLGHMSDLERIFVEFGNRSITGSPAETLAGTRDALSNMKTRPEIAFKCGPYALDSIVNLHNPADPARLMLRQVASTTSGTSLALLTDLAVRLKLDARAVQRTNATTIPVPAVVHWKLGHYGALLKYNNGRYLLQDPTFGNTQWISQKVIDEESSGYFLLTNVGRSLPGGWRSITPQEAASVWGKGNTNSGNPHGTGPKDPKPPPPPNSCPGMAVWSAHLMLTSLNLTDTPLSYRPPVGPVIAFSLNYDLREANQPATFSFSNFGNRWNFCYASTLTFDTNDAYLESGEGGTQDFTNFDSSLITYPVYSDLDVQTRSRIVRLAASVYQQQFPDGSMNVFELVDGSGRAYQTKYIDPQGNTLQFGYDAQFRLITITDAIGQVSVLSYTFSDPLKVTQITDPFGRTAQFAYNSSGQLVTITDAQGLTSSFTYGTSDAVLSLVTGYGTTSFASTDDGNNTRSLLVTLPDGSQEKFLSSTGPGSYPVSDPVAPQGMPVFNDFLQFRDTFHWDRKAMEEAPADYTKATVYHFMHSGPDSLVTGRLLESVKRPLENREWYFYQGEINPGFMNDGILECKTFIGQVLDDGSTQLTQNAYDAVGNLTQTTDPVGRTTLFVYDANGVDLLTVAQAHGPAGIDYLANLTYNDQHLAITATDGAGQTTTLTYNAAGQLLTLTDPKQEVTTYAYDGSGYRTSIAGPGAGATALTILTYDNVGRIQSTTDSLGYTRTFGYDNLDRVRSVSYPDGTQYTIDYQLLDVSMITDRLHQTTQYTYDSLRHPTTQTDPLGHMTSYHFCACGALESVTDELGRTTRWAFDIQGRKIAKVYADGSTTRFHYENTTSRLQWQLDARQQATYYQYNIDDSLRSISYSTPAGSTPSASFTYDPFYLRVTSMTDGTGTTSYVYKPYTGPTLGAGRVASVHNPLGEITFDYDELGRITLRSLDGAPEQTTFDSLGRVSGVTNPLGSFSYGYLDDTRLLSALSRPNGQNTVLAYFGTSADNRLASISHLRPGGAPLSQWSYAYDPTGQITSWSQQRDTSAARVLSPQQDAAGRLTAVTITNPTASYGYAYDDAGNRLMETVNASPTAASYNALNELTAFSPPATANNTFEWDAENRLVAINYSGTSDRTEFAYDGLSRRVSIVEMSGSSVLSTRRFLWDGFNLAEELDANGAVVKRYYAQGVQIVSGSSPGGYFYALDHLGSVTEVTDAAGSLRARYAYDPFGRQTKLSGDLDFDLGYTRHFQHARSGLALAPFRAYDPNAGRWISRDPFEESVGLNLYAYVGNRPLVARDPLGLDLEGVVIFASQKGIDALKDLVTPNPADTTFDASDVIQISAGIAAVWTLDAALNSVNKEIRRLQKIKCPTADDRDNLAKLGQEANALRLLLQKLRLAVNQSYHSYNQHILGDPNATPVPFPNPY